MIATPCFSPSEIQYPERRDASAFRIVGMLRRPVCSAIVSPCLQLSGISHRYSIILQSFYIFSFSHTPSSVSKTSLELLAFLLVSALPQYAGARIALWVVSLFDHHSVCPSTLLNQRKSEIQIFGCFFQSNHVCILLGVTRTHLKFLQRFHQPSIRSTYRWSQELQRLQV